MRWFPFSRKDKPEPAAGSDGFYSRAEAESSVLRGRSRGRSKDSSTKREPVDPVLPEKKRARRRLVGAVALVLALVIGLPMILDSEPKPLGNDISIQIPSKNKTPPAPPAAAPASPVAPQAAPAKPAGLDAAEEIVTPAAKVATPMADAIPAVKDPSQDAPAPAKEPPAALPRTAEVALAKPAAKLEPKTEARTERKAESKAGTKDKTEAHPNSPAPAARQDDTARAQAILEGKFEAPAAKSAVGKSGKFVVQVAALASTDKVAELRGKLSQAGISSYTQKVATASGERIRVRVGPFASKDEAEKIRSRLGKLGLNGTLVPA